MTDHVRRKTVRTASGQRPFQSQGTLFSPDASGSVGRRASLRYFKRQCRRTRLLTRENLSAKLRSHYAKKTPFDERLTRMREQNRILQTNRNRLVEISSHLAEVHGINDQSKHWALLVNLCALPVSNPSHPLFEPDAWKISRDLTAWKKGHQKLRAFSTTLAAATESLDEIAHDPVLLAAIQHVDVFKQLPQLVGPLFALADIALMASQIEGKSGNRPHPTWALIATDACRAFWREQMGKEPKRLFNTAEKSRNGGGKNKTTEPANPFSCWFCDVMRTVAGYSPAQCDTLLRLK